MAAKKNVVIGFERTRVYEAISVAPPLIVAVTMGRIFLDDLVVVITCNTDDGVTVGNENYAVGCVLQPDSDNPDVITIQPLRAELMARISAIVEDAPWQK